MTVVSLRLSQSFCSNFYGFRIFIAVWVVSLVLFRCFGGFGGSGGFVSMVLVQCFMFWYMPTKFHSFMIKSLDGSYCGICVNFMQECLSYINYCSVFV